MSSSLTLLVQMPVSLAWLELGRAPDSLVKALLTLVAVRCVVIDRSEIRSLGEKHAMALQLAEAKTSAQVPRLLSSVCEVIASARLISRL